MLTRDEAERRVIERVPTGIRALFGRYVPGGSFADLGCMWNADGAYVFCAELLGATAPVLALDINPPTQAYISYHTALQSRVQFVQSDILDLDPARNGTYDVVFCSGVMYHMMNPLHALSRVLGVTRRIAILVTHTVPGDDEMMVFYPHSRRAETFPWEVQATGQRAGRFAVRYGDFSPWWWGFTEPCFENMLKCFGFVVEEVSRYVLAITPEIL